MLALAVGLALDRRLVEALRSPWLWLGSGACARPLGPEPPLAGDARLAAARARRGHPPGRGGREPRDARPVPAPRRGAAAGAGAGRGLCGRSCAIRRSARGVRSDLAYPALLVLLFAVGAKPYYAAPLVVCLLAPGGVVVERWLRTTLRAVLVGAAIVLTAATSLVVGLPVVPVEELHSTPVADVNEDAIETVGWPAFARTVAEVHRGLSEDERATRGRVRRQLRRGRRRRPLRPRARAPARVLRAQRVRALRHPAGLRGAGDRARLRRPERRLHGLPRRRRGSTTGSSSRTRSRAARSSSASALASRGASCGRRSATSTPRRQTSRYDESPANRAFRARGVTRRASRLSPA